MKYTHFDDIAPNNRTEFAMLYFATMRTMRKLEAAIRKTNNGRLTGRQAGLLLHLQHKLMQMAANHNPPSVKTYRTHLNLSCKWFGITFVGK